MNKKKKEVFDLYSGYYTFPFSGYGFEGQVIKLDRESMNILFQEFSEGNERIFREKLMKMDQWLIDKPHKVSSNWLNLIVKWMQPKKDENA